MIRRKSSSKPAKQRVYKQPLFSPENADKLKKGVAWAGLGLGGFFAALPGIDIVNHDLDTRFYDRVGDVTAFYGELSQPCESILSDTRTRGLDKSARISIVSGSGLCNVDAVRSAMKINGDDADVAVNVAVGNLIVRDMADNNAVDGAAISKNVIGVASGLAMVALGAATAVGLGKINSAVADAFADYDRRPSVPTLASFNSSAESNLADASMQVPIEMPYVPLRASDCWLKAHLTYEPA
jgi:hypothetical protein